MFQLQVQAAALPRIPNIAGMRFHSALDQSSEETFDGPEDCLVGHYR